MIPPFSRDALVFLVPLFAAFANTVLGQAPLSKADFMDDGNLLNRADVQRELELLDYQVQGMKSGNAAYAQRAKDLRRETLSLEPSVAAQKAAALFNEVMEMQVKSRQELLVPSQLERLVELRSQYRALRNPVEAFNQVVQLSDGQKEKMKAKELELREELLKKVRTLYERQEREILNVLTPEQRLEWQKQIGDEFRFETESPGLQFLRKLL